MLWRLKSGTEDSEELLSGAKAALEDLRSKIDGLEEIRVSVTPLPSSSADASVECIFRDRASLEAYKTHPEHIAIAKKYIKPYSEKPLSFDEEI